MPLRGTVLCLALVLSATAASADPLAGKWTLNLGRSHYGGGAERRKQETFTCQVDGELRRCTIESVRVDGQQLVGTFSAPYDGKPHPVSGIPDVDQVTLRRLDEFTADATFSYKGKAVFGYRAIRSDDGRSLAIVSVEPTTRVVGNSVVVYDRAAVGTRR